MAITKKELVDRIAQRTQSRHVTVKTVVQQFLDEIVSELVKNNRLEFRDFGVFEVRQAAPRTAQNPKTLEPVRVPAKRVVKFKMGRRMGEKLNSKAAKKR
ncbi:MAG: HU family DNA-binding protein [Planctomycetota bacterium]